MAQDMDWRAVTARDLDAAHAFLAATHPGAHPRLADATVQHALTVGFAEARAMASRVQDAAGYRAVLRRFANGFRDAHVAVSFTTSGPVPPLRWPGFLVGRVNGTFRVVVADSQWTAARVGDVLDQCDGTPIETLARDRLGMFHAMWHVEADIIRTAPRLLLDDGNPFVSVLARCRVRRQGETVELPLDWHPVESRALNARVPAPTAALGVRPMGVTRDAATLWVAMSDMTADADAMLGQLRTVMDTLASQVPVVIDLRGNRGGSSSKGDSLIRAIFGRAAEAQSRAALGEGLTSHWRVSDFAQTSLDDFEADRTARYGATSNEASVWRLEATAMRAARARGAAFVPDIADTAVLRAVHELPRRPPVGRARTAVVLTDHLCFSSCLMLVAQLRHLGVRHLGVATSVSRRYMETRSAPLPSGFATLSTLQKVAFGAPDPFGPYVPDVPLPADVIGSDAVERWVLTALLARRQAPAP
jgi:hypothetical protein